jgi:hypothetical protein
MLSYNSVNSLNNCFWCQDEILYCITSQ